MNPIRMCARALIILALAPGGVLAQDSVHLEELTWTEARAAIDAGATTAIIPTGGTEQNGPHMVLGKHNYLVRATAEDIARELGGTLVAPVLGYVPEGSVDPPSGHMRSAGTITLPREHFERVVEYAARSMAAHGFTEVLLIGDSGGNQAGLAAVADLLNAEWADQGVVVRHVSDYYGTNSGVRDWLLARGFSEEDVGSHAGISDTSHLMFVHPEGIRDDLRAPGVRGDGSGVTGNPTLARPEIGREIHRLKVAAAVRQVRELRR
jgi:creatinine amidohydrolase/Fe(II)-dependent formamide hydrolase-like protein